MLRSGDTESWLRAGGFSLDTFYFLNPVRVWVMEELRYVTAPTSTCGWSKRQAFYALLFRANAIRTL